MELGNSRIVKKYRVSTRFSKDEMEKNKKELWGLQRFERAKLYFRLKYQSFFKSLFFKRVLNSS